MWKIYVALMLWTQSINAQQDVSIKINQGGDGKNTFKPSDIYFEDNYKPHLPIRMNNNTNIHFSQLEGSTCNTTLKDSFENTHTLVESDAPTHTKVKGVNWNKQNANTPVTAQPSTAWEIPFGATFNSKLYDIISSNGRYENIVYSPFSLQTLLAFIFTFSGGKLYEELAQLLAVSSNRTYVAKAFEGILQTASLNAPPTTTLILANKLFYDYRFGPIDHNARSFANKSFASEVDAIDFFLSNKAASIINSWVSERTRNLIQDIITPSSISDDTSALLLNSIYFKGEWLTKFATYDTETQNFFMTRHKQVPVNMMYNEDVFRFGEFPKELQASVVELPYKASNLSMMLILPKDTEGLANLKRKLRYYTFESISQKLKRETVTVKLPRFKIEYEIDMIKPLRAMGLNALFNNDVNLNIFKKQQKPLRIDQFKHKSFINVNEAGTEAAATTVAKYIPLSIPIDMKYFVADHPFLFVIRDLNCTLFIGHVVEF